MNIVLTVTGIIFILCALSGLIAGFLRKASGILSFILAGFLVTALLPTVTGWLHDSTPVYGIIREQCAKVGAGIVQRTVSGGIEAALAGSAGGSVPDGDVSGGGDAYGDVSGGSASGGASGNVSGGASGNVSGGTSGSSGSSTYGGTSGLSAILNSDGSINRTAVKSLIQQYGYDPSVIDGMSDDQIKSLISQYTGLSAGTIRLMAYQPARGIRLGAFPLAGVIRHGTFPLAVISILTADIQTGDGISESSISAGKSEAETALSRLMSSMTSADERKFIESLPIPETLQEQMEAFNNSEGYLKLGANDFASYVTNYFASLIMNVVAYLVTLLIAWIIIRLIIGALGIFTRLPLIRTADHVLGLVLGLVQGLLIVWFLLLILSFFAALPVGQTLLAQVHESPFLDALYNTNMFMKGAGSAMKGIL